MDTPSGRVGPSEHHFRVVASAAAPHTFLFEKGPVFDSAPFAILAIYLKDFLPLKKLRERSFPWYHEDIKIVSFSGLLPVFK